MRLFGQKYARNQFLINRLLFKPLCGAGKMVDLIEFRGLVTPLVLNHDVFHLFWMRKFKIVVYTIYFAPK
jgi:hypothetical protein